MTARHSFGWQGVFFGISLVAWVLWTVVASLNSQLAPESSSPYIVNPVMLVIGALSGRYLRRGWQHGELVLLIIVPLIVTVMAVPIYANASAAVGGLLLALAGLAAMDLREPIEYPAKAWRYQRESVGEIRGLQRGIVLALIAGIGIWLVLESQAATVLALLVVVVVAIALWLVTGPPRWISIIVGSLVTALAAIVVIWLGSRESWPAWLAARESLSSARHTLWSDALSLWATQPFTGAGPGAFTPWSDLASSTPHLEATHSLILRVGAELGTVGVILLAAVFVGSLLFVARGDQRVALIAIAALTALAIHTSIDHLEDFPIVGFMAGIIQGWSAFGERAPRESQSL